MKHLAYFGRGRAPAIVACSLLALGWGAFGCTAGVKMSLTGTGGSGGTTPTTGKGGSTGTGGVPIEGSGGGGGDVVLGSGGTMETSDGGCQQMQLTFTPTNPTVYILVDLSGSNFDTQTTGTFFNLRPAVEQVVQQLQGQVRFGIASFVGDHSTGSCQLDYSSVPPALNNYNAIKTAYDSWGPLQPYGSKADTPMVEALPKMISTLQADTDDGPKYIMLVTDSETDFCDDGNPLCPADAVTYQLQTAQMGTPSIGALVVGLPSSESNISVQVLQNFANAGAGQPVAVPTGSGAATATDVYYQCNGMTNGGADSWSSLFTAAGRTGMTSLATYAATGGSAMVFAPTDTSTTALTNQISAAVDTIPPSCTFDLSTFKIDLTKLNEAGVFLNGVAVPLDSTNTNGWDMVSPTQLQLFGPACTTLQTPNATENINFQFPCDIIITVG